MGEFHRLLLKIFVSWENPTRSETMETSFHDTLRKLVNLSVVIVATRLLCVYVNSSLCTMNANQINFRMIGVSAQRSRAYKRNVVVV